jgi:hypothetical protein
MVKGLFKPTSVGIMVAVSLVVTIVPVRARAVTCTGEAGSGKAIGGKQSSSSTYADSAIGDCLFFSYSQIGQRISSVCHIGQIGGDDHGSLCRVKAEVIRHPGGDNVIKRVIKIERIID